MGIVEYGDCIRWAESVALPAQVILQGACVPFVGRVNWFSGQTRVTTRFCNPFHKVLHIVVEAGELGL